MYNNKHGYVPIKLLPKRWQARFGLWANLTTPDSVFTLY